jgi:RimJ/RimL family protein N-acetyltransferase
VATASAPIEAFPPVELTADRLLLRAYRLEDAADVQRACSDAETQRWLPLPNPYTLEHAVAWSTSLTEAIRESGAGIEWAAARRGDQSFVGAFGLKRLDWRGRTGEIGYWVAPWARGEGLATEAVRAIARWFLVDSCFERLELRAAPGNLASQRVAEKAGFTREGVARNAGFIHDGRVDLVVFGLTRSDFSVPARHARPHPASS